MTLNVTPNSTVLEGSKVTLTCDVQGEGPVNVKNYSFTGNGVPVATGTSNTYDIANINDTTEGDYTCSADGVLSIPVVIRSYGQCLKCILECSLSVIVHKSALIVIKVSTSNMGIYLKYRYLSEI